MKSKIFLVIVGIIMTSLCVVLLIIEFTISQILYLASWIIWTTIFITDLRLAIIKNKIIQFEQNEKGGLN